MAPAKPPIVILGVPIDDVSTEEAVDLITRMMLSGRPHYFATANVDFLVQAQHDPELHRILLDADLVLCDGSPVLWASRLLGQPLRERVAGADLVPLLLRAAARHGLRVFLLGAAPESLTRAAARLAADYPGLTVAGHYSPPFAPLLEMDHAAIAERVGAARPHLLLVAFGCPKQEKWIAMHRHALRVPVAAGIGASIDFLSGHMRRAPLWMQRFGLEWAFRLLQEPRRLFARYARDFRVFFRRLLAQYRQSRRDGAAAILRDRLNAAGAMGEGGDCLVDLSAVEAVGSGDLGLLVALRRQILRRGGELVLLTPRAAVRQALRLMHLDAVLPTAPDAVVGSRLIEARRRRQSSPVRQDDPDGAVVWQSELTAENLDAFWPPTRSRLEARAQTGGALEIDLSALDFVDSAGLMLMRHAQSAARRLGVAVTFRNPSATVRQVARLGGVERSLFDTDDG